MMKPTKHASCIVREPLAGIRLHIPRIFLSALCVFGVGAFAGASAHVAAAAAEAERPPLAEYRIYHAVGAPPSVAHAARELRDHLALAVGRELEIVHEAGAPMIALGDTASAREAGITADALPWEAARIVTRGNNLYIAGRDLPGDRHTPQGGRSYGTLYGAYAFLEQVAGVRWLMPGEHGTHVPVNPGLTLPKVDWIEKPGFHYRCLTGVCNVGSGSDWYLRQRIDQNVPLDQPRPIPSPFPRDGRSGVGGSIEANPNHAWNELFPLPAHPYAAYFDDRFKTFAEHPDYFEMGADGQRIEPGGNLSLCLSHPEIAAEVARRVGLLMDQGHVNVSIFPNDATPRCACGPCRERWIEPDPRYVAIDRVESVWSRVVFEHSRDVAVLLAESHPGKTVTSACYYKHEVPYAGLEPLPDNLLIFMAPVRLAYGPMRYDETYNRKWHNLLEDWRPYLPRRYYVAYDFWWRDYSGAPMPPYLDLMRETFSTFVEMGYQGVDQHGMLGYGRGGLLNYLSAKLLWDPTRDPEALVQEFCEAAYGTGAESIKALFMEVDRRMAAFICDTVPVYETGYNTFPELLRDVYGTPWKTLEQHYLQGLAAAQDADSDAVIGRIEQLGDNLKLLYYHVTRLGLGETDSTSPLYLTDAEMHAFNRSDRRRAPWPVVPVFANPHIRDALQPVGIEPDAPAPRIEAPVGILELQYHQDILVAPERDGPVTVEIEMETAGLNPRTGEAWLPDIPYYTLYDLDARQSLQTGIASAGRFIRFDGEAGRRYLLMFSPNGRYLSGTRYRIVAVDAPWALGDKVDTRGVRLASIETPLYFYVPSGLDDFQLYFTGRVQAEIIDPSGAIAATVDCAQYEAVRLTTAETEPGFWTVRYLQRSSGGIRQDRRLSGYFTVDPTRPLAVIRPADD